MSRFQNIIAEASGLIKNVGEAIDRNITTEAEKLQLFNELQRLINEKEKELTARQTADMNSDSWLSKNVRPLTLITLLGLFLVFSLLDALNVLHVANAYIDMLQELNMLVMAFYFGSRGLEKISNNFFNKKNGK